MIDIGKISLAIAEYLGPLRRANWKVIILCFSTAATFWFFNALNKVYTTRINYPVALIFNRDSLVTVKDPPEEIPVNVTAGGWQLLKRTISMNTEPVRIAPENPVQTQFFTAINLLPIFSDQLSDLNINYIATDTMFFKIEPYAEKRLCIKLDSSSIQLKEDFYIMSELKVEPDSVNFRGPVSLINQLPDVFLVALSDRNISSSYDEELSLDLFSPSLIKKDPEVIRVSFDVEEYIDQIEELEVALVNFPYDSSIYVEPNTLKAQFKLRRSYRSEYKKEDFLIIADLSSMPTKDSILTVEVMDTPEYIMDLSLEDNRVKVIYDQ